MHETILEEMVMSVVCHTLIDCSIRIVAMDSYIKNSRCLRFMNLVTCQVFFEGEDCIQYNNNTAFQQCPCAHNTHNQYNDLYNDLKCSSFLAAYSNGSKEFQI